jgi:hypothetical protein
MYVQRNMAASSRNHSYSGKAMGIKYCECVFVALVIKHAKHMLHVLPVGLCNMFQHYLINGTNFEKTLLKLRCVF